MMAWCAVETHPEKTELWVNIQIVAAIDMTNHRVLLIDGIWRTVTGNFQDIVDGLEGCDL